MAILKCKMCGGDVELSRDKTFGTCEYCGNTMTFPKVSDDQRAAAFNRGNHFRRIGEFDKALAVYERIVREDEQDAEAHWCCALCRFGIEYVEDPVSYEWLPTCHRASFDSFLEDVDYLAALEYSEGITRRQYQRDAAKIAEVQRGILATSQNAQAYDVFICYKESDAQGERTRDSLLAQEIYYQLTEQRRKVFFARITLEDVVGTQYEPYIFAALNSARVMIVVGTSPDHLNAVWVKNEWSRFLSMMKKDRSKLLLPCYRDMDPYDMPEQLSVLQSYDMAKIGFIQDLTRGIAKVLDAQAKPIVQEQSVNQQTVSHTAALLRRGAMSLEDGEWEKADQFFEEVLNQDPECGEAYFGKAMAAVKSCDLRKMALHVITNGESAALRRARQFAQPQFQAKLQELDAFLRQENLREEEAQRLAEEARRKAQEEARRREEAERIRQQQAMTSQENRQRYFAGMIARSRSHMVGVKSNGSVLAFGSDEFGQCSICRGWQNIQRAWVTDHSTIGLKFDGTVVAAGQNLDGELMVRSWRDIVSIAAGNSHTVGLRRNGTVVASGRNDFGQCNVEKWTDIVQVAVMGDVYTFGLKKDGTVVKTGMRQEYCIEVLDWRNIVAICATKETVVGLKQDGTVVAAGRNNLGGLNVKTWTDIIAIAAEDDGTLGLRRDGTVLGTLKQNAYASGMCYEQWENVAWLNSNVIRAAVTKRGRPVYQRQRADWLESGGWTDVVACWDFMDGLIGVRSNGSLAVAGNLEFKHTLITKWKLFERAETVLQERQAAIEQFRVEQKKRYQQRLEELYEQKKALERELENLQGFFSGGRRREVEARIAWIDQQLKGKWIEKDPASVGELFAGKTSQ